MSEKPENRIFVTVPPPSDRDLKVTLPPGMTAPAVNGRDGGVSLSPHITYYRVKMGLEDALRHGGDVRRFIAGIKGEVILNLDDTELKELIPSVVRSLAPCEHDTEVDSMPAFLRPDGGAGDDDGGGGDPEDGKD